MGKTNISVNNGKTPAPRWYRVSKKVIYTIAGSSIVSGTLQRFGVNDADCLLIMGWLLLSGELLDTLLSNGETYAKKTSEGDYSKLK